MANHYLGFELISSAITNKDIRTSALILKLFSFYSSCYYCIWCIKIFPPKSPGFQLIYSTVTLHLSPRFFTDIQFSFQSSFLLCFYSVLPLDLMYEEWFLSFSKLQFNFFFLDTYMLLRLELSNVQSKVSKKWWKTPLHRALLTEFTIRQRQLFV